MKKIAVILLMLVVGMMGLKGQPVEHRETVIVVKPHNPMVDDAFKINLSPVISDTVSGSTKTLNYSITPVKLSTDIEVSPIKAARMSGLPQKDLYRLLLKSGFGNYTTPYFELFYNSLRSRSGSYGLHYRHLSSHGRIDSFPFPGYSENGFDAYGTLFGKKHDYSLKGEYNRDVVHYYGRPDSLFNDTLDKDLIRQRFHRAGVHASMQSNSSKEMFYKWDLAYRMVNDLAGTTGHVPRTHFSFQREVTWFNFSRYQIAGVNAGAEYHHTTFPSDTNLLPDQQLLVRINPYMSTKLKELDIRAGFMAGYESVDNGTLRLYPDIMLTIALNEHKFLVMGGLEGGMERNTFESLALTNPYVISNPELRNTVTRVKVYGGLRTALGKKVNFTARVSTESLKNMVLFTADTSEVYKNRFAVLYDDGSVLMVKGEVTYQAAERIRVGLKVQFNDYNLENQSYAWHMPAFEAAADVRYSMENKIIAYLSGTYLSGIMVQGYEMGAETGTTLPAILDLNAGIEYRYSSLLSGFLRLNNLAASRYYRWQHYPTHRFNFMLGVTYAL